jgi:Domain of unknown function (DUF4157)
VQTFAHKEHVPRGRPPATSSTLLRSTRALPPCAAQAHEQEAARLAERVTDPADADAATFVARRAPAAPGPDGAALEGASAAGQALEPSTRRMFERRLGHDFSRVRVHSDRRAAEAARGLNALAYTLGPDIVFGTGQYSPATPAGRRLLAHELVHVVQQSAGPAVVQRQPAPAAQSDAALEGRNFVRATIEFLSRSAEFYADPATAVDGALFDRVINSWYVMVVDRERMIDTSLGGDATLKAELHSAYINAIRALVSRAAATLKRSEADLYRENTGRIPMWAWPTPHHAEPGISTPIEAGQTVSPATGGVGFARNGFEVSILPDATDPSLTEAETQIAVGWTLPGTTVRVGAAGDRRVDSFTPIAPPTIRIRTLFGPGVSRTGRSAYGRGTTRADIAGGRVTPRSTSLGFHEGMHGLAAVEFLQANPAPQFTGRVGMTEAEFNAAIHAWDAAMVDYNTRISRFSQLAGDCVGTTIDQFHRGRARGAAIRLVCP